MPNRKRSLWFTLLFAGGVFCTGFARPVGAWDESEEAREDAASESYREQNERWNEEVEYDIEVEIGNEAGPGTPSSPSIQVVGP